MVTGNGPRCRWCDGTDGQIVLDLGNQPSCETFPGPGVAGEDPRTPLRMWFCAGCGLAQLAEDPGPVDEQMPVVEPRAMTEQIDRTLAFADAAGLLRAGAAVAEYGSPHGRSVRPELVARGMRAVPTDGSQGPADLVVDIYGLLHEADQRAALEQRQRLLDADGVMLMQTPSFAAVVEHAHAGILRHGHFGYWSLSALDGALRSVGSGVRSARSEPFDGGTLVVIAGRGEPDASTAALLEAERASAILDAATAAVMQQQSDTAASALRHWLEAERAAGRRVVGYGAATRAVPMLCHAGVDRSLIAAVGDAAAAKWGRRIPGTGIPVVSPSEMLAHRPDRVVLFLADLLDEMRAEMPQVEHHGASWVVLDPTPTVVARMA